MTIELEKLNYEFQYKPLLIGGKAMEYYGLRKAGKDIDLVVHPQDHANLVNKYPDNIKNLYGDIGVCEFGIEIWNQICTFDLKSTVSRDVINFERCFGITHDRYAAVFLFIAVSKSTSLNSAKSFILSKTVSPLEVFEKTNDVPLLSNISGMTSFTPQKSASVISPRRI